MSTLNKAPPKRISATFWLPRLGSWRRRASKLLVPQQHGAAVRLQHLASGQVFPQLSMIEATSVLDKWTFHGHHLYEDLRPPTFRSPAHKHSRWCPVSEGKFDGQNAASVRPFPFPQRSLDV